MLKKNHELSTNVVQLHIFSNIPYLLIKKNNI